MSLQSSERANKYGRVNLNKFSFLIGNIIFKQNSSLT